LIFPLDKLRIDLLDFQRCVQTAVKWRDVGIEVENNATPNGLRIYCSRSAVVDQPRQITQISHMGIIT
jgi:hypothetical protein